MLSCTIWFSAPSLWICGGLESRCVVRVYGADGAVRVYSPTLAFQLQALEKEAAVDSLPCNFDSPVKN